MQPTLEHLNMRKAIFLRFVLLIALAALSFAPAASCLTAEPPDDAKIADAGIRKLTAKHLTLYTDAAGDEIDRLPAVFDQAFPEWRRYFDIAAEKHVDWRITGCLMKDKKKFAAAGLLPDSLPPFEHGYSTGDRLWLYDQPVDFYRRELLLHEGTHCFMFTTFGGAGPPWYMEGLAEYLGVHRLDDGRLELGYMPRSREESPGWGRVRTIQDAVAARKAMRLRAVVELPFEANRQTATYAWQWALVTLLERHPRYQKRFHQLLPWVQKPDFNERFYRLFKPDWQQLCEQWQLMVIGMEYGYDVVRSAVDFTPGRPWDDASADGKPAAKTVMISADRGWQNTGLRLEAGKTYRLSATGRYQLAQKPKIWWCEPGGVSIRYYQGRPLGILLAAVRPDHPKPDSLTSLARPTAIGLGVALSPDESGTLFLKINDSAAELDDNVGQLKIEIRKSP
jgi:hypothetical protein